MVALLGPAPWASTSGSACRQPACAGHGRYGRPRHGARTSTSPTAQARQQPRQSVLNGKLAQVDTDNTSNGAHHRHAGCLVRPHLVGGRRLRLLLPVPPPPAAVQCREGDRDPGRPADLLGGSGTREPVLHRRRHARVRLSIGSYLTLNTHSQRRPQRHPGVPRHSVSVTAVGYQGLANTCVTVNQLITASGGAPAHDVQRHDDKLTGASGRPSGTMRWPPGRSAELQRDADPVALRGTPPARHRSADAHSSRDRPRRELCQLVSINGSSCGNGTLTTPPSRRSLNALQMLTTEAEVAQRDERHRRRHLS